MSRLVDIDNYLVLENGTIKETSFKQDIQIQNQTLMINEDAKVQIFIRQQKKELINLILKLKIVYM
jgi:Fe-S cluster assembly protein SufD